MTMRCVWLLTVIFVHSSADLSHNNLVKIVENVLDEVRLSSTCNRSMALYRENLVSGGEDAWALRMLDATSKIPVGFLTSLNFGELGDFNQCLATESKDGLIKAKYCLARFNIASLIPQALSNDVVNFHHQVHLRESISRFANVLSPKRDDQDLAASFMPPWTICLPSDCSDEDVVEILSQVMKPLSLRCQIKEDLSPPLTSKAIVALVVLAVVAIVMITSTAYDLHCHFNKSVPASQIFIAFSMYTNGRKLFKINNSNTELSCLNGMRVLSMMWVIMGHMVSTIFNFPLFNFKDILDWANSLSSMAFVSGTLSVDTFFVIGGALLVYVFMKARRDGRKFNIFQFYIHRYLRLTPPLAAVVLVSATLLEYIGSGPNWGNTSGMQEVCGQYWWSTLLYIQNYVNCFSMCVSQTWYLSVDMQLYIISPLFFYPLVKFPKVGLALLASCVVAFIIVPFCIAYDRELSGLMTSFALKGSHLDYMEFYYLKTHTRAAPWFIGALLGYWLARIKLFGQADVKPKINKILLIVLWTICFALMITCIYSGHSTLRGPEYDRIGNAFYIALIRPVWSICVAWVIFACVLGYGGPINWILSFPVFQVLNRFTYSVYLLHMTILSMIGYANKRGVYFSVFNLSYWFWGICMFSFGLSIIWVLAFESPVIVIEKLLFKGIDKVTRLCGRNGNSTTSPKKVPEKV